MKSDERSISAIAAQAHNAEADKRTLQKKLAASERRARDLENRLASVQADCDEKVRSLTDQLSREVAKVSEMMQQLVAYMMGKGDVSLAGTIHETVVAGIREEVRKEMRQEYQGIIDEQAAEIAALKALQNHDNDDGESAHVTIKKLEHQNEDLRRTTYGQKTEGKYNGRNDMTPGDEADLNGEEVPESTFEVSDDEFSEVMDGINAVMKKSSLKSKGRKKGQKVPHRPQPLKLTAREIVIEPDYVPDGAVLCKDQEDRTYRIVRHPARAEIVCFVRPKYELDHKYYQAKAPRHGMGKCKADASVLSWIIYEHLVKHVTLGEIETELRSLGLNIPHSTLCHWLELAADRLEPLDEPLHREILTSGDFHSDESTLQVLDVPVGTKEDEEVPMHYYIRWIYDFIAPGSGLTQYWFYDQGRRTQEAVEEYVKGITEKTYIHTDGAKMYEIFNAAGIIMRVACAVHVRRPFWKLKDASDDAARIVYLFDSVFRKERTWNEEEGMTNEERRKRRWEEVYPILHEIKNILDRMEKELDKETEPDLVRAVSFAQKEYPQLLRYLDDGKLAFSNNICELQMRQIAIYRNNSFFLGSVKSAKRFARLASLTQSAKNCKRNVQKYFHDILNRVMVTAKEELTCILPHKWVEPVTIPLVY
jgi:hypothetical protein